MSHNKEIIVTPEQLILTHTLHALDDDMVEFAMGVIIGIKSVRESKMMVQVLLDTVEKFKQLEEIEK